MTAALLATLEAWLESDDPVLRAHAEARLALGDALVPPEEVQTVDPWLPLILACPDHNPGCCAHPAAFCSRFLKDVSRDECIACLSFQSAPPRRGEPRGSV